MNMEKMQSQHTIEQPSVSSVVGLEEQKADSRKDYENNSLGIQNQKKGPSSTLKWLSVVFAVIMIVLVITLFALVADLNRRVDDLENNNGGSSAVQTDVALGTSVTPPSNMAILSELYRGAGQWASKAKLSTAVSDVATVTCNGKVYVIGGLQSNGSISAKLSEFDPVFETYTDLAPMPQGRYRHGAACVPSSSSSSSSSSDFKLYVVGGFNSTSRGNNGEPEGTVFEYSSSSAEWSVLPSQLQFPRGDAAVTSVGSKVYIFGGYGLFYDMSETGNSVEILETSPSPALSWTTGPQMPTARGDVKAEVIGSKIYLVGGWNESAGFQHVVEVLDTDKNTWESVAPLPLARGDVAVSVLHGKLHVVGGEIWSGTQRPCDWDPTLTCNVNEIPVHNVDQFDPATNHWTALAPLPTAKFRFDAAAANGVVFVFGGHVIGTVESESVEGLYLVDHPNVFVYNN